MPPRSHGGRGLERRTICPHDRQCPGRGRRVRHGVDRLDDLLRGLYPILGLLGEQSPRQPLDLRGDAGHERRHRRNRQMDVRREHVTRALALERRASGAQLEQDTTERI